LLDALEVELDDVEVGVVAADVEDDVTADVVIISAFF
jgi:hypothetical protein